MQGQAGVKLGSSWGQAGVKLHRRTMDSSTALRVSLGAAASTAWASATSIAQMEAAASAGSVVYGRKFNAFRATFQRFLHDVVSSHESS